MEPLLQVVFGLGFSLVMMATRILNLAHGSYVLFGGFIFLSLSSARGWHPLVVLFRPQGLVAARR